jgi:CRISPR-associated protein Csm5
MTYLETGVYTLKTLSPIHIRAGAMNRYGQGAIRLNNNDEFLYVIDSVKLQSEIYKHGGLEAVETYSEEFGNPNRNTNITTVLRKINYDYRSNIKKISKGVVPLPSGNRFMRSGFGENFIPGSSIKGAIKTAVLYKIVKDRIDSEPNYLQNIVDNQTERYLEIPQHHERDRRRFKRTFAQQLLSEAFLSRHPHEQRRNTRRNTERPGPFTDIFKAIKIKDGILETGDPSRYAKPLKLSTPGRNGYTLETLAGEKIYHPYQNMKGNFPSTAWIHIDTYTEEDGEQIVETYTIVDKPPQFAEVKFREILSTTLSGNNTLNTIDVDDTRFECLQGETKVEITIDHEILESFKRANASIPFKDLDTLMNLCQNFAQAQWEEEQQFMNNCNNNASVNIDEIKKFYTNITNQQNAVLRVGWGTGMLGTTVNLLLDEDPRIALRNDVISDDGIQRPQTAPKSRRFVLENGQPIYPLGWISLEKK